MLPVVKLRLQQEPVSHFKQQNKALSFVGNICWEPPDVGLAPTCVWRVPPIPHRNWRTLSSSQTPSLPALSFPLPPTPLAPFARLREGAAQAGGGEGSQGARRQEGWRGGGLQAALKAKSGNLNLFLRILPFFLEHYRENKGKKSKMPRKRFRLPDFALLGARPTFGGTRICVFLSHVFGLFFNLETPRGNSFCRRATPTILF